MLSRFPTPQLTRAGMIVLALLASLPEVVCCCDVSWGPGGLLGGKARCSERCEPVKSCCHQQDRHEDASDESCDYQDSKCRCSFTIISPAPISTTCGAELDQDLIFGAVLLPTWAEHCLALQPETVRQIPDAAPPLASAQRCAFLQTWLI